MGFGSTFIAFVRRLWNPYAFLQALSLAAVAVALTVSMKSFETFDYDDCILPLGVFTYVYWRNGVLNQTLHEAESEVEEIFERRPPRLGGRSAEYIRGSPPVGNEVVVLVTFATWCAHSRHTFSPLASMAAKFGAAGSSCKFVAVTRCGVDETKEFVQDLTKHSATRAATNLGSVAVCCDRSGIVDTLTENFRCNEVPHVYIIKNNSVEWDGHPANAEPIVSRLVGLYDSDSDE